MSLFVGWLEKPNTGTPLFPINEWNEETASEIWKKSSQHVGTVLVIKNSVFREKRAGFMPEFFNCHQHSGAK